MKNLNTSNKTQRGFFDFGLAIAILASSGIAIYTVAPDGQDNAYVQQQVQSVAAAKPKVNETNPANKLISNDN